LKRSIAGIAHQRDVLRDSLASLSAAPRPHNSRASAGAGDDSMNVVTAFVWLMSAGVLAIAAVPQRQEAIPHHADGASVAPAKPEVKREREDAGQRRRVRVVLTSPYEAHRRSNPRPREVNQKPPERVDPMVVSALSDRKEASVRAEASSSRPSDIVPVASRSRASAVKREHRRQARAHPTGKKSVHAAAMASRVEERKRVSVGPHVMVATIDQRP
jgi:hypothetical protein